MTETFTIRRGYIGPAGRQEHYRRAGSGSPLVLLLQTPEPSDDFLTILPALAADHGVHVRHSGLRPTRRASPRGD
ncbi:MAG: hypothetical protein U0556_05270 [Dehalococcoidia bacterium]